VIIFSDNNNNYYLLHELVAQVKKTKNRPWHRHCEFIWWMQTEHRVSANPQTKPVDLGAMSLPKVTATIHIHIHHCYFYITTRPISWYSFYHPTEGGRLSRPRYCSKGAQPMPKAVYRSGCHDKHNRPQCDSNLGTLTPQSDVLSTRPLLRVVSTMGLSFFLAICCCT